MKYICTEDEEGYKDIFTFPRSINHDVMAEALEGMKNQTTGNWKRIHRQPISAGFVDKNGNCYGESKTLNLEARKHEDTNLLIKQSKI